MRGIFCVDPGESTGLAWGIVDEKSKGQMALTAVKERLHSSSTTLTGDEPHQIRAIYSFWTGFKRLCVQSALLDPEWVDLVIEDFVLFPGEKPGRSTTTPERIAWGFEGYRMAMLDTYGIKPPQRGGRALPRHYSDICWQKSGAANRFAKRDILTKADAWIVGKQHERSAFAHMILRTNILLDNRLPFTRA